MAYASKELKVKVNAMIKAIAKDMGIKLGFSIKLENYSKIIVNIRSCSIDLAAEHRAYVEEKMSYYNENPHLKEGNRYDRIAHLHNKLMRDEIYFNKDKPADIFSGKALELLEKILAAVKCDHYDDSDAMRYYFDAAYYYDICIADNFKAA